jgi:hypothetical protein
LRRSRRARSAAAQRAVRTKGPAARRAAARKAVRTKGPARRRGTTLAGSRENALREKA